jgi:hypothetical protein
MSPLPPHAPTWTDLVLVVMGAVLTAGLGITVVSSVPLRVTGSISSLAAVATLLGGMVLNPDGPERGSGPSNRRE